MMIMPDKSRSRRGLRFLVQGKKKYNQLTGRRTTSLCSSDGITHPELMDGGRPFLQEYNNSAPELKQRASSLGNHYHYICHYGSI
jgi:hypothetical protein